MSKAWLTGILLVMSLLPAAVSGSEQMQLEMEASKFMDDYLAVYNRRFGRPQRSQQFREELGNLVTMPFIQSPPTSKPRVPATREEFTKNFEGFVTMLEGRGVVRLVWAKKELRVLSSKKVLVNNIGHGLTADNEIAYQTISLYLLYREDDVWRIAMFSPYDLENQLELGG